MKSFKVILTILFNSLIASTLVAAYCEHEQDGTYIAHPKARHMFYYCFDGSAHEGECYAGQEFDPFYRVCTAMQVDWNMPDCSRQPNGVS